MDATTDPASGSMSEVLWEASIIGGGAAGPPAGAVLRSAAVSRDGLDAGGAI
ncbi:hypothetical protein [Sphaerisporangium fuscum]|uniref:hypothetical protein n=1 Tax=Sphaerisporangium fuscum TaxID=2835868 RepID=UPI001BDD20ED|nr:hypothetical protein [Sphaerisporangium fuscum]